MSGSNKTHYRLTHLRPPSITPTNIPNPESITDETQAIRAAENRLAGCGKANEKLFVALLVVLIAPRQNPAAEAVRRMADATATHKGRPSEIAGTVDGYGEAGILAFNAAAGGGTIIAQAGAQSESAPSALDLCGGNVTASNAWNPTANGLAHLDDRAERRRQQRMKLARRARGNRRSSAGPPRGLRPLRDGVRSGRSKATLPAT